MMPTAICPRCGLTKPESEFPLSTGRGKILRPRQCKICRREVDREKGIRYRERYPERRRLTQRNSDKRRPDRWRTDPLYRAQVLKAVRKYQAENREALRGKKRKYHQKIRRDVLTLYGQRCECCGEEKWEFLAIDHRHGGGHRERKQLSAPSLWLRLLRLGVPHPDYRILCHNCNSALGSYGYCPHQTAATLQ
jgi:hypothetical protein